MEEGGGGRAHTGAQTPTTTRARTLLMLAHGVTFTSSWQKATPSSTRLPTQSLPLPSGVGFVQVRRRVRLPGDTVTVAYGSHSQPSHGPHSERPPSTFTVQTSVLHGVGDTSESTGHAVPPGNRGGVQVRVRVRVPPPHGTEQGPKADQSDTTAWMPCVHKSGRNQR